MAKIIGICGSPRKESGTEYVLKLALAEAARYNNIDTELITLANKNIKECIGCEKCTNLKNTQGTYCVYNDDANNIINNIINAEGCIIASPVYITSTTGILKILMDRLSTALWTPNNGCNYKNKFRIGSAITVGAVRNGGQEMTLAAIHNFLLTFGYLVTGGPCFEMGINETHMGVSIWSKDGSKEAVKDDSIGLKNLIDMAKYHTEAVLSLYPN